VQATARLSVPIGNKYTLNLLSEVRPKAVIGLRFQELEIDPGIRDALRAQGFQELYPPQEESLPTALRGDNLVLAVPTASGKSLVAYLAILNSVLKGGKAVYIVPLRALASEKYEELKRFENLGIRVAKSVGDYDAPDLTLEKYDVIIATSEKADSLLRHRMSWPEKVTVVVADEIHLLNDPERGPTLEVIISKFRMINPKVQIVALSATIRNSEEIAEWLHAVHITSDWRPVPLKEGIYLDGTIYFSDNTVREISDLDDPVISLVNDCLDNGGQALVFANTRRSSESLARSLRSITKRYIEDPSALKKLSKNLPADDEEPTLIGRHLAECMRSGVAFHNAGLTNDQRRKVEELFRIGKIKCVVATPTLAAGINLPARMVIIRETSRYNPNFGNSSIPVLEIKQMCGRAGRPKYDEFGEAVLVAKNDDHRSFLLENYLLGEPERIFSKLGTEPAMRSHLLAAIATGSANSESEIANFFEHTFLAVQTEISHLQEILEKILDFLESEEMIHRKPDGALRATFFGKRVSDLYLDPKSAVMMRKALEQFHDGSEFGILHALAATTELQPLYLRQKDYNWTEELLDEKRPELLLEVPDDLTQFEFFLAEIKTASLIFDWMWEKSEEYIEKKFGIGPGDIRNKMEIAEWMAYSMDQLSAIFQPEAHAQMMPIVKRIANGVREELLELVKLRNIGRVRSRILFDNGIRDIAGVRLASVEQLASLPGIGQKLAIQLKQELGQKSALREVENAQDDQKILTNFR